MNTSGVAEPPEMSVASVARLVSVFVGADVSVTLMPGYAFSKSLISTWRTSVPLVLIGLAHQLMVPDVAFPGAVDVPLAGVLLAAVVPLLLPLLLQPAAASAPTAISAATCQVLVERLAANLRDLARAMYPPTRSSRSITLCNTARGLTAALLVSGTRLAGPRAASPWLCQALAVPCPARRQPSAQPSRMIWVSWPAISASACCGCFCLVRASYTALEMARLAWS